MDKEHIKEEQKYQDSIAKYYFESYESDYVKKRWDYPLLEKYLKYVQKGIVLDLGCGTGATSYFYSKNNYQVISSDLSTEMLKKVKERGNDSILLNSLAESIPLKDNSVSHVVCFGAFHHFNNKKKSLEEINRVLKKNGTLLIVENNSNSLHKKMIPSVIRDYMQPKFKKKYGESVHEEESHEQTLDDYINLFQESSLSLKSVKTFYFARIVSLAEKSSAIKFVFENMLKVMDKIVPKKSGFFVAFLLEKRN